MSPSVLKRKLETKSSISSAMEGMTDVWAEISKNFLKSFTAETGIKFTTTKPSMGKIQFNKMLENKTEKFPIYPLASGATPSLGFLYYSMEATSLITDKKLGASEEEDTEETDEEATQVEPGLLELLLLQPLAQQMMETLETAFGSADPDHLVEGMMVTDRIVSLQDLVGYEPETDLFHVVLTLTPEEEGDDRRAVLGFCLRYSLMEKLSIAAENGKQAEVIDMGNPWQSHMYDVSVGSRVPLKIVLDNCPMTVGDCSRLKIGQTIDLIGASLDKLDIRAETKSGATSVGQAVLGVYKQNKAIKLLEEPNSDFLNNLAELACQ